MRPKIRKKNYLLVLPVKALKEATSAVSCWTFCNPYACTLVNRFSSFCYHVRMECFRALTPFEIH